MMRTAIIRGTTAVIQTIAVDTKIATIGRGVAMITIIAAIGRVITMIMIEVLIEVCY